MRDQDESAGSTAWLAAPTAALCFVLGFLAFVPLIRGEPRCFEGDSGQQPRASNSWPGLPAPALPVSASLAALSAAGGRPDRALRARLMNSYGKLPLTFEANVGQVRDQAEWEGESQVKFLSATPCS